MRFLKGDSDRISFSGNPATGAATNTTKGTTAYSEHDLLLLILLLPDCSHKNLNEPEHY